MMANSNISLSTKDTLQFHNFGYITTNTDKQVNIDKPTPNKGYKCLVVPCSEGDAFYIIGAGGNGPRVWAFLDTNRYKISMSDKLSANCDIIYAPKQTAYLVVNDKNTGGLCVRITHPSNKVLSSKQKANNILLNQVQEGSKNDMVFNTLVDISPEFLNYQQQCIHHDNFHRDPPDTKRPWQIGNNYLLNTDVFSYSSPRDDYSTVDDGFRLRVESIKTNDKKYPKKIISGYLTNERKVSVANAFRIIDSYDQLADSFIIEVSFPSNKKYSEIVFNFNDEENYESFLLYNDGDFLDVIYKHMVYGFCSQKTICHDFITASSIRIVCTGGHPRFYLDELNNYSYLTNESKQLLNSISIDHLRPLAIKIDNAHDYEYRALELYNIVDKYRLSVGRALNTGKSLPRISIAETGLPYVYQVIDCIRINGVFSEKPSKQTLIDNKIDAGQLIAVTSENKIYRLSSSLEYVDDLVSGNIYYDVLNAITYIYDNTKGLVLQGKYYANLSYPSKCQRFEIREKDANSIATNRSEVCERDSFTSNLRKRHFSFSVFLPVDYVENDNEAGYGEAIFQLATSTEGGKSRGPVFSLSINHYGGNNDARWQINRRTTPTKNAPSDASWWEDRYGEEAVDLGACELGRWIHWDIYLQEGYMPEHSPFLLVMKDGNVVYKSFSPNCNNTRNGSNFRYGLYKSAYYYHKTKKQNRKLVIFFADFMMDS